RDFHVTGVQTCALPISTHIQQNLRWLLLQQYACKPTNHCASLMRLTDSKYCPRLPSASTPTHATGPQADQAAADLLLEPYGVGVEQGDCQRISRVRLGGAGQAQQLGYHVLHLGLLRRSGSDHLLLDLSRRILMHLQPGVYRRHYGSPPCLPELERGIRIARQENLLDAEHLGPVL